MRAEPWLSVQVRSFKGSSSLLGCITTAPGVALKLYSMLFIKTGEFSSPVERIVTPTNVPGYSIASVG